MNYSEADKNAAFINRFALVGLNGRNINEYYQTRFNRWRFDNSDDVFIDGEKVSPFEKAMIKAAFYKIRPEPEEIIVSDLINESKLTEERFVDYEIKRVSKLDNLAIGKEYNKQDYLEYLNIKQAQFNKQPEQTEKPKQRRKNTRPPTLQTKSS